MKVSTGMNEIHNYKNHEKHLSNGNTFLCCIRWLKHQPFQGAWLSYEIQWISVEKLSHIITYGLYKNAKGMQNFKYILYEI